MISYYPKVSSENARTRMDRCCEYLPLQDSDDYQSAALPDMDRLFERFDRGIRCTAGKPASAAWNCPLPRPLRTSITASSLRPSGSSDAFAMTARLPVSPLIEPPGGLQADILHRERGCRRFRRSRLDHLCILLRPEMDGYAVDLQLANQGLTVFFNVLMRTLPTHQKKHLRP